MTGMARLAARMKLLAPLAIVLLVGGCAASPSSLVEGRLKSQPASRTALAEFKAKRLESASQHWQEAVSALTRSDRAYFETHLYQDRYRYLASIAWVHLAQGNVEKSRRLYSEILEGLRADEESHRAILRGDDLVAVTFNSFVDGLSQGYLRRLQTSPLANWLVYQPYRSENSANSAEYVASLLKGEVVGGDGVRMVVLPAVGPLMNIGKFQNGSGSCTASLVGKRIALTNAHCVTDDAGAPLPIQGMRLVFDGLAAQDAVNVVEVHTHGGGGWDQDYANDWALLVLDRHPIQRGYFGWLRAAPEAQDPGWLFLAGFSGDLNDGRFLSLDWGCSATPSRRAGVATDNCLGWKGSSGTPMLLTKGPYRGGYIYALHAFGFLDRKLGGGGPLAIQFGPKLEELRRKTSTSTQR